MLNRLSQLLKSSHSPASYSKTVGRYALMAAAVVGVGLWMYQRSLNLAQRQNNRDLLKLPYHAFDQSMGKGWRSLSEQGKYEEAAELIVQYLNQYQNQNTHDPLNDKINELFTLYLHAAQCFGFAGDYEKALHYFELSKFPSEMVNSTPQEFQFVLIAMNAYKDGNLAFLKNDGNALSSAIEVLRQYQDYKMMLDTGQEIYPFKDNLKILLTLQNGLKVGLNYHEAYGSEGKPKKPRLDS